ncbi:MAG: hypothetical protein IJZ46_04960 [Bacilli bacterium]|nr:hypothetical protein [Bacilli bacterium]
MKEQDVITLDDGKEYLLLDELQYENKKYFFAVEIDEKGVTQEDKGGIFLKATKENGEEYVETIDSPTLLEKLYTIESVSMAMQFNPEYQESIAKIIEDEQKGGI